MTPFFRLGSTLTPKGAWILIGCLWGGLFFYPGTSPVAVAAGSDSPGKGIVFTDPARTVPMSVGWLKRSIRYSDWARGADLAVTLDQQIHAMLLPAVAEFARERGIKVQVRKGTCGTSSGLLIRKQVDMAGFCCPPGETDRLPGLRFHTLGIAAIVLVVHPDNPVNDLPLETVRAIFRGDRFRWSEIEVAPGRKGPRLTIHPVGRLHCKLRPGHWRALLENADQFGLGMSEVGAIPDMIYQVLASPGAIGYETLWHLMRNRDRGQPKVIAINGLDPHRFESLISGRYPLYRVFNLTTWEKPGLKNAHADALVDHLMRAAVTLKPAFGLVPAAELRRTGWVFQGNELVGERTGE